MTEEKKSTTAKKEKTESIKPEKKETKTDLKKVEKTTTKPKAKNPFSYENAFQQKFVRCIMKRGKKVVAQRILKMAFDEIIRRGEHDPEEVFEKAFKNATPSMEVRPKRVGGAVFQIPIEVKQKRQDSLSIRWILIGAQKRKGIPMYKRLAAELLDAYNEQGFAFNKKVEAHKAAHANKAFAHLARY